MPFELTNRTALITGGASGIGEAICRVFSAAGARILIVDIDRAKAEALASELPRAHAIVCDITDEAAVKKLFSELQKLDILVNNAGIGLVGGIEQTELGDFQRLFRVNVEGMFLVTRAALPHLIASHGSIVNSGSVAGLIGVKMR